MIPRSDDDSGDDGRGDAAGPLDVVVGLARGFRTWIVAAVAVLAVVAVLLVGANRPADPRVVESGAPGATDTTGATGATGADGSGLARTCRSVGEACLELLVAETPSEREAGLRGRESVLERVDGMLFLFEEPTDGAFTMSEVVEPLEIGFYDADGERVGGHVMEPCAGSVEECPTYGAEAPFRFAVETAPGELPDGPLGGSCEP